ncbi:MAG: hypothetical protein RH860_00880 [Cytophagales bacterium]
MNDFLKYSLLFFVLIAIAFQANSQQLTFDKNSDLIKAKKGDTIIIKTDSAYVLSGKRADYLNDKLDELDTIKRIYNNQSENHRELIQNIDELDDMIRKLRSDFERDSLILSQNLSNVINELNLISEDLKENNQMLKVNNTELQKRVVRLQELITELKKEMRGIWWNGIADKVIAFAAGIGTGAVLILLL